jgi:hypothetical protein
MLTAATFADNFYVDAVNLYVADVGQTAEIPRNLTEK